MAHMDGKPGPIDNLEIAAVTGVNRSGTQPILSINRILQARLASSSMLNPSLCLSWERITGVSICLRFFGDVSLDCASDERMSFRCEALLFC